MAGPCCTVVPEDAAAAAALEAVHAHCLTENLALMLATPSSCELLLAPVKTDPSACCTVTGDRSFEPFIGLGSLPQSDAREARALDAAELCAQP